MPFSSFGLSPALVNNIAAKGFSAPYPIQKEAIPAILKRQDVLGISKTGSGKTASYVLPILSNLQSGIFSKTAYPKRFQNKDKFLHHPLGLR